MGVERRVFVAELGQGLAQLAAVLLVVEVDLHLDDRRRYIDGFQQDRLLILGTEGVTRLGILHTHESDNLARASLGDLLAFLRLDAEDATHALTLHLIGVVDAHAVGQLAAENTDEGLLAHIRIIDELEGQSCKGFIFRRVTLVSLLLVGGVVRDDGTQVLGRRQVVDDGIQKELDTFILIGGATEHRHHHQFDGGLADGGHQLVGGDFLVVEVELSDLVVEVGDLLNEVAAGFLGLFHHMFRDGTHDAFLLDKTHRVHLHQVDHTLEIRLCSDG